MTKTLNMDKELKEIRKMMHEQHEDFNKHRSYRKKPNKSFGAKRYNNQNAKFTKANLSRQKK